MPPTPAPSLRELQVDRDAVVGRLDELQRAVEAAARSAEQRAAVPAIERRPVADAQPVVGQLQEVWRRLERVLASPVGRSDRLPMAPKAINWSELESLRRLHRADREAAKRATSLLTPAEVVAKYGQPTELGAGNGGIYFSYERAQSNGGPRRVSFTFVDGYLVYHEIKPDR